MIEGKLGLELSHTKELHAWLVIDGKKVLRLTLTNEHGGRSELSSGATNRLWKVTKLDREDFVDLLECPLSRDDYIEKLKAKGLI